MQYLRNYNHFLGGVFFIFHPVFLEKKLKEIRAFLITLLLAPFAFKLVYDYIRALMSLLNALSAIH